MISKQIKMYIFTLIQKSTSYSVITCWFYHRLFYLTNTRSVFQKKKKKLIPDQVTQEN